MRSVTQPEARRRRTRPLYVLAAAVVVLGVVSSSNQGAVLASPVEGKATVQTVSLPAPTFPPYEMLSSATFSLDDIIFCERFQQAYAAVLGQLGADELSRLAADLGGVSGIVRRYMDSPPESAEEFRRALASESRGRDRAAQQASTLAAAT